MEFNNGDHIRPLVKGVAKDCVFKVVYRDHLDKFVIATDKNDIGWRFEPHEISKVEYDYQRSEWLTEEEFIDRYA